MSPVCCCKVSVTKVTADGAARIYADSLEVVDPYRQEYSHEHV